MQTVDKKQPEGQGVCKERLCGQQDNAEVETGLNLLPFFSYPRSRACCEDGTQGYRNAGGADDTGRLQDTGWGFQEGLQLWVQVSYMAIYYQGPPSLP